MSTRQRHAPATFHEAHGSVISSATPLHALPETDDRTSEVAIRWATAARDTPPCDLGTELLRFEHDGRLRYGAYRSDSNYTLRFDGCCDFFISLDLRTVECVPVRGVDHALTTVLAEGALLAFIHSMQKRCILHASAVQLGSDAVAFVGGTGFGKSTVAARLCAAGCQLISDDVLRIDLSDDIAVFRGTREVRLRPAAREVARQLPPGTTMRETADGRLAVSPTTTQHQVLPLRAVVIPLPRRDLQRARLEPLTGPSALTQLIAVPRLVGWKDPTFLRDQLRDLAHVAQRVPVFKAHLPWSSTGPSNTTIEALLALPPTVAAVT